MWWRSISIAAELFEDRGVNNMVCVPVIKNILILDSNGERVAVKYYNDEWPTVREQKEFEAAVYHKAFVEAEIRVYGVAVMIKHGDSIVVYRFVKDLCLFVTGSELILAGILQGFYDTVGTILRKCVDNEWELANFGDVLQFFDETVDWR